MFATLQPFDRLAAVPVELVVTFDGNEERVWGREVVECVGVMCITCVFDGVRIKCAI